MNKKWLTTIEKNYGSLENYKNKARKTGAVGGSAKVKKGFAKMDKKKHLEISTKGGLK